MQFWNNLKLPSLSEQFMLLVIGVCNRMPAHSLPVRWVLHLDHLIL